MGNGTRPGPIGGESDPHHVDEGTLSRIGSPAPGAIGLDAKGGTAKGSSASIPEQILSFARRRRGERVGDGECFALADTALRGAGAKSAADYGTVSPDADYVWGQSVTLANLQPGDVVQFRGYRYDREVVTEETNGTRTETDFQERPHHTAIVDRVEAGGRVTVLEQNAPPGSPVTRVVLFFSSGTTSSGRTTTTITVQGSAVFYRAEARP